MFILILMSMLLQFGCNSVTDFSSVSDTIVGHERHVHYLMCVWYVLVLNVRCELVSFLILWYELLLVRVNVLGLGILK